MDITTQIKTIFFSIIFGIIFSLMININYKFLTKNKLINIISTFIFIMIFVIIYFILLRKINYGIFSQYEIICIILGFIIEHTIETIVEKKLKKWYTHIRKSRWIYGQKTKK